MIFKKKLSVSVVIPSFNAEQQLPNTISALLSQTRIPDEILIVDDGSTDSSVRVAESFGLPVRVITQANSGAAAARYKGVIEATGDFIVFNDAGDISLPRRIELLLAAIINNPDCVASLGITWNKKDLPPSQSYVTRKPLNGCITVIDDILNRYLRQSWPLAVGMNIGILREVALKSCKISPFFRAANDYALQIKTACHGSFACVDEILLDYEQTLGGISSKNGHMRQRAYALCAAIDCFEENKSRPECDKAGFKQRIDDDWPEIALHMWLRKDNELLRRTINNGIKYGRWSCFPKHFGWALAKAIEEGQVIKHKRLHLIIKSMLAIKEKIKHITNK